MFSKSINLTHLHRMSLPVSYTHLRAHETRSNLVCRLLLEKNKKNDFLRFFSFVETFHLKTMQSIYTPTMKTY